VKANEALRASEEQFRRAIEASPIPVMMHAEDGQVLQISNTWTELTGYTKEEIPTFDACLQKAYGPGAEKVRKHVQTLFSGNARHINDEVEIKAKSGEVRTWAMSASAPGKLIDGRRFVVAMALDITERRRVEEALSRNRVQLEEALKRAEEARGEADAANKAKDHFLATLSHELRTPLTPILVTAESLLKNKSLPERVRKGLEMISRNIELETHFINDLLDLTRISKGKFDLVKKPVDVHAAIQAAMEISDPEFTSRNQKVSVSLQAQKTEVLGDFPRLEQVFWNLLKNASKFTPEKGRVRISTENEGNQIVVRIEDSGTGIDPGQLTNIFEAFRQGDTSISRKFGGLGLGLAISKATVEHLEGTIEACSEGPERGSVFTVRLPLNGKTG
jgi:two-component system CheB/CheR fusion protein